MDWLEWLRLLGLPTIGSAAILAAIGFLCRNWFIARITNSIKHEYDKDLEIHKDNLRKETDSELTRLRGNVEIEVEKAKLKFNLYSQKQFELYNDLWLALCELRRSMDELWQEASSENMWDFQEKLLKAYDVLEKRAILIEPRHYGELHNILKEFVNYQMGKQALINLRKESGKRFDVEQIQQLISYNMESYVKLSRYIDEMRDCLRSQISGNF